MSEFVEGARQIFDAALTDGTGQRLRALPTSQALHQLKWKCSELEALERLAAAIGDTTRSEVEDVLRRWGLYVRLLNGEEINLDAAWSELTTRLRSKEIFLGALQLEGVSMASATIPLTSGFELRRFDGDAWEALRPNVNHEQLNPDIIAEQVFLTREGTHVLPPRQLFYSPPRAQDPPRRDVLWVEWWQPLLALALFRPEDFAVGVRLEITPKWRLRKNGDFRGDFLPVTILREDDSVEEIGERWQNSIPDSYSIESDDELALTTFVTAAEKALTCAVRLHGDRVRIAAKRFLSAAFRLPGYMMRGWHPDEDETEKLLLDLVRSADGLLLGAGGATEEKFVKRAVLVRDGGQQCTKRMSKAYQARSEIAHGSPTTVLPDLWLLHEDVRFIFLGFLGLSERYPTRKVMLRALDAAVAPQEGRALQRSARPAVHRRGYPPRRST